MKKLVAIIAVSLALGPMYSAHAGLVKTAVKVKATKNIVNHNKNDSTLKKALKLKAVSNTAKSDDPALKRAVKYKVIKEM